MNKFNEFVGGCSLVLLMTVPIFFIVALIQGFVAMNLWNWLLVPLFEVLPVLTWKTALGLSFVIAYFTKVSVPTQKVKTTEESVTYLISSMFVTPLLTLLLGYIISLLY